MRPKFAKYLQKSEDQYNFLLHTIRKLVQQTANSRWIKEGNANPTDIEINKFTFLNEIKDVFHGSVETFFNSNTFKREFNLEGDIIKAFNM